jgi:hypothetical protein
MNVKRFGLETLSNVVVIAAGLVVLAAYAKPWLSPPPAARSAAETYAVGDRIRSTTDLRLDRQTFLLYTKSTCAYCDASMGLYREMIEKGARVIAFTAEDPEFNRAYLASHKVSPERVLPLKGSGIAFRVTPSLVLVDQEGTVVRAWWGKQDRETEEAILRGVQ